MRVFGLGMPELVVILIIILLLFGPKNLPKIGSALGRTVKNLRAGMEDDKSKGDKSDEEETEVEEEDSEKDSKEK